MYKKGKQENEYDYYTYFTWDPTSRATIRPQRGHRKWEHQQHMLHMCHNKSCWRLLPAAAEHLNWSSPVKGQLLARRFLWASRTLAGGSQRWRMRRLTREQSGGNPAGRLDELELTCRRTSRRPNRTKLVPSCNRGLPVWTTKILRCQTWDFSSSVELSAAVLKQTPQQEGWRPNPFLKQARGDLEDIETWRRTYSSRPAPSGVWGDQTLLWRAWRPRCTVHLWVLRFRQCEALVDVAGRHWVLSCPSEPDRQLEGSHPLWHHGPEDHVTPQGRTSS